MERTYEGLTTYLTIINDLCEFAGFESANVDGMGNVLLRTYVLPSKRSPIFSLQDGEGCEYRGGVGYQLETWGVPNAYTCISSPADGTPMSATVTNDDPDSITSTVSRGYVVDGGEIVSDIEDSDALLALAERRLADATSKVESIELEHLWMPYRVGDVLRITLGLESWTMATVSRTTNLVAGTICETRLRRFVNV